MCTDQCLIIVGAYNRSLTRWPKMTETQIGMELQPSYKNPRFLWRSDKQGEQDKTHLSSPAKSTKSDLNKCSFTRQIYRICRSIVTSSKYNLICPLMKKSIERKLNLLWWYKSKFLSKRYASNMSKNGWSIIPFLFHAYQCVNDYISI